MSEVSEESQRRSLYEQFGKELATDLDYLVWLHDQEIYPEKLKQLGDFRFADDMALLLDFKPDIAACNQLDAELDTLKEADNSLVFDSLAVDYAAIYCNYTYRASPLESVWLDEERLTHQGPMFDLREIYAEYDLEVKNWRTRSEDHLVCQVQFIAHLLRIDGLDKDRLETVARFYDEHLYRWLGDFAETVSSRCKSDFYKLVARVTYVFMEGLRNCIAQMIGQPRQTIEQIEARLAGREDPGDTTHELKFMPGGHSPSW